jgi:hypothetical protein
MKMLVRHEKLAREAFYFPDFPIFKNKNEYFIFVFV